ncbi:hypothetical protein SAMN04489712_102617 [Thermomonospora echinospora]|uniref:Uncharacterized protein n=1 Tax=Thermomonospora echinospora TaxID=1992 RepID=A0A1H5W7H4_9ACTN|nr:hypothetical protein [Thermomonospora echinospora]SEF95350.1 hypothetical protein SAMN04489712_102617 [Thermomonospora echinospora]
MRVYLPSTLAGLARVLSTGEIGPAPVSGYAVTPALREWYAEGDTEELEYAAMTAAARASLRLLAEEMAADPQTPPRRVVLAVEVPEGTVQPGGRDDERALVQVTAPVLVRDIAAGHVDDSAAADDVRAAVRALPAADAGDEDALFTVEGAEGHELMWYATQELGDL